MKSNISAVRGLLQNRNFSLFISSDFLATFGTNMTMFAIWSQVMQITHNDPLSLGLATVMEILPGLLVAPWAGLLADRVSKRGLLIGSHLARAVIVLCMFFSTELWHLYLLAGLHSTFGAFGEPPRKALLPLLVRPEQYVLMNSFFATANSLLQMLRPALSGAVVWSLGYKMAFLIDFFTYFIPVVALLAIKVNERTAARTSVDIEPTGTRQQIRDVIVYIRSEPILVYLFVFMMMFTFAMAMQGTLTLLFVGQYLATPETASSVAGLLFSALGIGGVLGAFLINRLVRRFSMLALLFSALVFDGAVVIVFSLSHTFLLAWICFALLGIIGSVIQIVQDTIIQTVVPEHMRGRVYGAFGPITGPISLLSIAGGASLASVIGTRMVFLLAGVLEIVTVVICRLLPSYSRVRDALLRKFAL